MTLRSADFRFVLPHQVEHALVFGDGRHPRLTAMASGLREAGVRVVDSPADDSRRPDLVIAAAAEAAEALRQPARAHLLVGRPPVGLRCPTHSVLPLLLRGDPLTPRLIVPLVPLTALRYYLLMAAPANRLARGLGRGIAPLTRLPLPAGALAPTQSQLSLVLPRGGHQLPVILQAATEVGVRADGSWLLRLGRGDVLQRAVFTVLDGQRPAWVVKFSRVAGYDRSFVGDATGLALARTAGGAVAAHAPAHLGRLDVGGLTFSVETAAVGTQLGHLLRRRPWRLLDSIAQWIGTLGRHTAGPKSHLAAERERMRQVVSEVGVSLGAPADLVDRVPPIPAVLQHNDLGSWNIISDGSGFTAVDWESARRPGFPMWDLFYFAADVLTKIDGPVDVEARIDRTLRIFAGESAHSPRLFRWIRATAASLDIATSALGALASLCWLHHGQSPARRTADLSGAPQAPLGHHPLLAQRWLEHPRLGVSWPALQG
jgi:hypothetical protein